MTNDGALYGNGCLPEGVRWRMIPGLNGLDVHVLEAGFEDAGRPALLLLHGFPELAFSWRHVMVPLARAGYHVIAPDVRGFGRTVGWDPAWDADHIPFRMLNLVRDALALVFALGHRRVAAVLGHDAGSPIAAWAALTRPDVFRSVMLLSAPFPGAPEIPFAPGRSEPRERPVGVTSSEMDAALAALSPPRKHYLRWYASREADADMINAPQGLHDFFRAYYHSKSADWPGNSPHRLKTSTAAELATMPTYYIMERDRGMAETVVPYMPSADEVSHCRWLTDAALAVYVEEYARTSFAGALWSYRRNFMPEEPERLTHANRAIEVPACFVAGESDWGTWQAPGSVEAMQSRACSDFRGIHLVPGAGHWVQQEQPEAVVALTLRFLSDALPRS